MDARDEGFHRRTGSRHQKKRQRHLSGNQEAMGVAAASAAGVLGAAGLNQVAELRARKLPRRRNSEEYSRE